MFVAGEFGGWCYGLFLTSVLSYSDFEQLGGLVWSFRFLYWYWPKNKSLFFFFSGMLFSQSLAYKRETGYNRNGLSFFSAVLPLFLLSLQQQVPFTFKIEFELPIRYEVNWFKIRMKNNVIFVLKMGCWPDFPNQNITASGSGLGPVSMTPSSWSFVCFLACFFLFLSTGFCWISKFWMGCVSTWSFTLFSFWAVSH